MVTGKARDLSKIRVLYCKVTCYIRSQYDASRLSKIDPPTVEGIHLGLDHLRGGVYVYVPVWQRFKAADQHKEHPSAHSFLFCTEVSPGDTLCERICWVP